MSDAVAVRQAQATAPAQINETAAILSMIERAARDQNVDLDKMERLLGLRDKFEQQEAEKLFNAAMSAAQSEMGTVGANARNEQTRSRYATYDKLDAALRPIYTRHGFALSFDETDCPKPDHIRLVCYVTHKGGYTRTYRRDMPADGKGAKGGDVMTKTHAMGAAASYGMRYLLRGIFNVAVGEEDRDGNAVQAFVTEDQAATLREWIDATGSETKVFLAHFKAASIAEFPASKFDAAVTLFKRKQAQGAAS